MSDESEGMGPKAVRCALLLSQVEMAEVLGVAPMTVSKVERGVVTYPVYAVRFLPLLEAFVVSVRAEPDDVADTVRFHAFRNILRRSGSVAFLRAVFAWGVDAPEVA